jgi:D-amino peptidase
VASPASLGAAARVAALVLAVAAPAWAQARVVAPRVLLIYDMEGVTAAAAPRDVQFGAEGYPAARESLTEDVNAAVRGLVKGGASLVVITDAHASGNPEPDYILERLPKGARFDIRDVPYDPYIDTLGQGYAAVVAVGMHGRGGGKAFLAHTYFGHTRWLMAGNDMNESMIVAASAARFGVPLVFVTGDDVLKQEIAAFSPLTEYVVVKKALSVEKAEPRPRAEVSAEIERAAERAFRSRGRIPAWRSTAADSPLENRFNYLFPEMASVAMNYPGAVGIDDKTIGLKTRDFLEAYLAFRALANFTQVVRRHMILKLVGEVEGGREIVAKAQARWPARDKRTFEPTGTEVDMSGTPYGRHGVR